MNALEVLESHQQQIDETGEMIGVSRRALDELIVQYKALSITKFRRRKETKAVINRLQDVVECFSETSEKLSECEKWVAIAGGITCPDCDDNGSYVFADSHGTETQCQCEFCHKCPQSKFNVQKKSKQRGPQE